MEYDIVFSCPELRSSKIHNRAHAGISYLRAYLENEGYKSKYARHITPFCLNEYICFLSEHKTKIYGFSITDDTLELFIMIAKELKKILEGIFIVIGGAIAKPETADYLLQFDYIDAVIIGEGEETIKSLIEVIRKDNFIDSEVIIPGLALWDKKNNKIKYKKREDQIDINSYPSPILNGFVDINDLIENGLFSSRGCIHRCIFCGFSSKSEWKVRYYDEDRFLSEFKYIIDNVDIMYKDFEIPIWDDTFTLNIIRAKKLLRKMAAINKKGQRFWLQTRIDYADEELVILMKEAGIGHIGIGLESASLKVLKNINKVRLNNFNDKSLIPEQNYIEKFNKLIYWCRKHRLNFTINIILGLPGESFEDGMETINLVKSVRPKFYFHAFVRLYTGVPLARKFREYNYEIEAINFSNDNILFPVKAEIKKYPYDVYKIPKLPNRLFHADIMAVTGFIYDTIEYFPTVLVENSIEINKILQSSYFKKKLVLVKNSFESLINNNIPMKVNKFASSNYFIDVPNKDEFSSVEINLSHFMEFYENLIGEFQENSYDRYIKYSDSLLEIRIDSKSDFDLLYDLMKTVNNGGEFYLPNHFSSIQFGGIILKDSCKWHNYCSSSNNMRSFVDKAGRILSCEDGVELSKFDFSDIDVANKFNSIQKEVIFNRKCKDCKSYEYCSKCISVVDTDKSNIYCEIQKMKIKPSEFFLALDYVIKQIIDPLDLSIFRSINNKIIFRPNSTSEQLVFLMHISGNYYYIVKRESFEIMEIGEDLFLGLSSLWNDGNLNQFRNELISKYDLSHIELEDIINQIKSCNII